MAYNRHILSDSLVDLTIKKLRYGWYQQDRLRISQHVLYAVLREERASRVSANWSVAFREAAIPFNAFGALFLFYAIMGYIEPEGVDKTIRSTQLSLGIGFTSFGIVNSIVSAVLRKRAIEHYNSAVVSQKEEPGIQETLPLL